ncbi:tape measure protein [Atrivirus PS6]|uniref:Tape measure protein n=1 Tax=Ruminococcus phage phiRgPS_6 TaxID=2772521 RepID=A0AAE7T1V6_9CAUD|nr:phage tail tape measure protein [Mediterraneibacter gnavus]QOI66216.1 tape measure protein [Ruminococcus phage phiRgPS_6]UZT21063.1 phage tail tape measure protein [Mediterraneibacter gnavus]UZT23986.1 phage tail tape measure protein [Mediterraneibacter gnavus]
MANSKIKGITIKFGADTTALSKALKSAEDTSKSLGSELSSVNKLLKFDPKNTQLLAQKQELLSKQVENTKEKLEALKQAQGEVEKKFKSGDIGAEEYREFQREIAKTEQDLKSYTTQISRMETEQKSLKESTKQLQTLFEATGKSLDDFQDILGTRLTNAIKNGTANSDDLTVALNKIGKEAFGAETDLSKMKATLNKVDDGASIDEVNNDLNEMKKNSGEAGEALDGIGKGIVAGNMMQAAEIIADAGQKIKEFSDNAKEAFNEVDAGSDAIITATGATGKLAEGMDNVYKSIASSLPIDNLENIGKVIGEMNTQFGFTDEKLQHASEKMLKFSEITGSDVVASTQNAKQAISVFHMSSDDLDSVLDDVAKTAQDTGVSVDDLFQKAIEGAPQLQELGLSFSDSVKLLGAFEQAGVDGSAALSSLSKAAVNYAKDGKSLTDGLAETQDKILNATDQTEALNAAAEVFGTKGAVRMVDAIQRGVLNLNDLGGAASDSQGTVETTFSNTLDPIDEETVALNNVKLAMAEFGSAISEAVAPILEALVPIIQKVAKWFSSLSGTSKTIIVVIGGIAMVISGLLPILAVVAGGIAAAGGAMAFLTGVLLPVAGIIAGIIAVVAAVVAVIKNWGDITDWLSEKWSAFKDWMSGLWDSISEKIQGVWNGIKDFFADIWEQIYNVIEGPLKFIEGTIGAVMYAIYAVIYTVWEVIKFALEKAWKWISDTASAVFVPVANFFSGIWNGIKDTATGIWNSIKDTLGGIWDSIKEKAMDAFSSVWKFIKDGFNNLKDTLGGIVKGIANAIVKPIGGAVNGVINGVNWVLDKVGSDKQFALWEVPKFARGTGGIQKDTLGIVNDQKGSTYKEMIVPPHGKPFIPEGRDVVLPLEKGTKIMPANQTKSFLEELPHFANGIGDFFGGIWDTVKDFTGNVWDYITHPSKIVQIAIDKFTDLSGAFEPWISVAKGAVSTVFDSVVGFVKGIFDTQSHVNYNPSAGVEQWRTLATRALQMTGQYSEANLERLLYQMQTESGGNPNAINNWDINAVNGTPSKGLMQVIDPTFRAYAMPGYDKNIYDPLSNMLASIRYAVSRYGSLAAAYRGVGYENGIGDINLSDLLPSLPMLDVKWFKDGGILTKPALFQMPSGGIGGAAEREAEAITPLRSLKGYIKESILEIMGEKDINLNINLTTTLDGRVVAQQTVGYARPMIKKMDNFEKLLGGERIGTT